MWTRNAEDQQPLAASGSSVRVSYLLLGGQAVRFGQIFSFLHTCWSAALHPDLEVQQYVKHQIFSRRTRLDVAKLFVLG